MFTDKKNQKRHLEDKVAALTRQLQRLAPAASIRAAFTVNAQNHVGPDFNLYAMAEGMNRAYFADMPRRAGLERSLTVARRRLHAAQAAGLAPEFGMAA